MVLFWVVYIFMRGSLSFTGKITCIISPIIEYIVHAHHMKTNISLVYASQMKRLVNTSKNFVLMIVKTKDVGRNESFKGCDPKL